MRVAAGAGADGAEDELVMRANDANLGQLQCQEFSRGGHGVVEDRATLALDLGTIAGWALRAADGSIASGTQSFKPGRFEGGGMRYLRFRRWLGEVEAVAGGIAEVYFEEVRRHAGVDAAHAYGGFLATLTSWCEHHGIPYTGVPVGAIKKHATGKGNADKAAMLAAARARGHAPHDDNEADALALLDWALCQASGASSTSRAPL